MRIQIKIIKNILTTNNIFRYVYENTKTNIIFLFIFLLFFHNYQQPTTVSNHRFSHRYAPSCQIKIQMVFVMFVPNETELKSTLTFSIHLETCGGFWKMKI